MLHYRGVTNLVIQAIKVEFQLIGAKLPVAFL